MNLANIQMHMTISESSLELLYHSKIFSSANTKKNNIISEILTLYIEIQSFKILVTTRSQISGDCSKSRMETQRR